MRRLTILVLFLYAGLTVYAILRLILKEPSFPFLTPLLTFLAFTFAGLHAMQRIGWKRMLLLVGLCFGISLVFESIGVATGLVYGPYHYTDLLGAKFLGLVPYLIPLAWFMMMYPSLVIAETVVGCTESPGEVLTPPRGITGKPDHSLTEGASPLRPGPSMLLGTAALGGLIMTAWDLALDPMMVSIGHWVWDGPSSTRLYFGVPLQNYWGWWLTAFVTFSLYFLMTHKGKVWLVNTREEIPQAEETLARRRLLTVQSFLTNWGFNTGASFDRLAVFSYLTTATGNILTALLIGLGGPALVGLFAMSPWIIFSWPRLKEPI
jgi:uncharacterized membrane protein